MGTIAAVAPRDITRAISLAGAGILTAGLVMAPPVVDHAGTDMLRTDIAAMRHDPVALTSVTVTQLRSAGFASGGTVSPADAANLPAGVGHLGPITTVPSPTDVFNQITQIVAVAFVAPFVFAFVAAIVVVSALQRLTSPSAAAVRLASRSTTSASPSPAAPALAPDTHPITPLSRAPRSGKRTARPARAVSAPAAAAQTAETSTQSAGSRRKIVTHSYAGLGSARSTGRQVSAKPPTGDQSRSE